MGRIQRTLQLAKASWTVLRADKELLALPLLSAVASLVIAASFIAPMFFVGSSAFNDDGSIDAIGYVVLFAMYVALAYVTIFFNAALIHAANERLSGGDPTLGTALRGAAARAGRIFPWAVISATVSIILRTIEERLGVLGRIVIGFVGLAWSLVTFLVLPILVMEDIAVGGAVRRSSELFKRTWGENVAAQIGFGLLAVVASLPAVALLAFAATSGSAVGVAVSVAVVWLVVVAVVVATLNGIFQTALYRYAVHGSAGGGFDDGALGSAFAPKR
jgi:hypothetical protein